MPIIKREESLPNRPVVVLLYGDPGVGKTSCFNTADAPLLLDFDRGVDRSISRQDTLVISSWDEVIAEEKAGTFKGYKTIGIDTAKAALDDFLMSFVIKQNYQLAKNKLGAYGAIGDEFKLFVNNRRADNADIVVIAHAKDEKEGDIIRKTPDVTGGSYALLLRIADQVGYVTTQNNKRVISWEPSDRTVGKNVARLPITEIPNETDPAWPTFMASLVAKVRQSITAMNEAQKEAMELYRKYQNQIAYCEDPEELTMLVTVVNELAPMYKEALRSDISKIAKQRGFVIDKASKSFVLPTPPVDQSGSTPPPANPPAAPAAATEKATRTSRQAQASMTL